MQLHRLPRGVEPALPDARFGGGDGGPRTSDGSTRLAAA